MGKEYKCNYKYCKKDGAPVTEENGVKYRNRWHHKECAQESENIKNVIDLYISSVDNAVVVAQLRSVVNNIILKKKVDSELLLYVVNYAIKNNIKVNAPFSLHYLVANKRITGQYEKEKNKEVLKEIRSKADNFKVLDDNSVTFKNKIKKAKGFEDILGSHKPHA